MQFFFFENLVCLKVKFKRFIIKILFLNSFFRPNIYLRASFACILPTIPATGPKIPSVSQFKTSSLTSD